MAKETRIISVAVENIGQDANVAGECVTRAIKALEGRKIVEIGIGIGTLIAKVEVDSKIDETIALVSELADKLRGYVKSRGARPLNPSELPRTAESAS